MESLFEISIILILILLNGFFAAAEIAILTARRGRLEQQAKDGSRSARCALDLVADPSRFLSTVQVGITIVGTLAAAYGGAQLVEDLSAHLQTTGSGFIATQSKALALALITALIAFLSLVVGELLPKRIALTNAERLANLVAWPMYWVSIMARPLVNFLSGTTSAILFLLRIKADEQPSVSIEDLEHALETSTREGVLESTESELALEALRLGERRVRDIMRPRVDIEALDVDTPPDEVAGAVAMSGFSRLPVYEGTIDRIIGFVFIKDILQQLVLGRPIELRKLLHPPLFVPDSLPLDKLLPMFQQRRTQLAVVVDEYSGTAGIVTFEDVLEELVGEIHDEHRRDQEQMIVPRDESSWLVDGRVTIDELLEELEMTNRTAPLPGVSTVSGVVLSCCGRIPSIGDFVEWNGLKLEVVDMDGPGIDRLLVTRLMPQAEPPPPVTS